MTKETWRKRRKRGQGRRAQNARSDSMTNVSVSGTAHPIEPSAVAEGMALYQEMFLQTLDGQNRPTAATEALLTSIFPVDGKNPSKTTPTP